MLIILILHALHTKTQKNVKREQDNNYNVHLYVKK